MIKKVRRAFFTFIALLRVGGYKSWPIVNGYTRLNRSTFLGHNVNFNGMLIYGDGEVLIGDNFHSGMGCKIVTQSHNHDGLAVPYDTTYKTFKVLIDNNVWLGMNVTIIGNVTIGEGAIIQVGSVVVSDIPKYAIAGGHPAKVFASRNVNKYNECVKMKKFH